MPRGVSTEKQAEVDAALAEIDGRVAQAISDIATSRARGVAYKTEIDEIDEAIKRLCVQRSELCRRAEEHKVQHATVKSDLFADVYALCKRAQLSANRILQIAAQLELESSQVQLAVARGRELLRALDGDPILCYGYIFLSRHGIWFGGRVRDTPYIELTRGAGGQFALSIPVRAGSMKDVCRIPLPALVRIPSETRDVSQVGVGELAIDAIVAQRCAGKQADDQDVANIRAALRDAELDPSMCDRHLVAAKA